MAKFAKIIHESNENFLIKKFIRFFKEKVANREKKRFSFVLTGGKSPIKLYKKLSKNKKIPWKKIDFFIGDERYVKENSKYSNIWLCKKYLLNKIKILDRQIYKISTNQNSLKKDLQNYEQRIKRYFLNKKVVFDLTLLGIGQDGHIASQAINRVLEAVGSEKNVHLCFGNYHGQTIQDSNYTHLIGFMNQLDCDCLVLELTRRSKDEIRHLRDVQPNIQFGIGVVDVKDLQIETPEQVARRIEDIAKILGSERIAYVNPDCGLHMLPRAVSDEKLKALVAGRNLYCGIINN